MIDANSLIADVERALASQLTSRAVTYLIELMPSWLGFLSGPLSWIIGLIVSKLVTWGDWATYYLGDSWMDSSHARAYQKAGEELASLPPTATKEEIDAKKKAKADSFDALMGAS